MRVHFQQLTEPITSPLLDSDRHDSAFTTPTPTQLKSQPPRWRRLQPSPWNLSTTPRACGDPIHSGQRTSR